MRTPRSEWPPLALSSRIRIIRPREGRELVDEGKMTKEKADGCYKSWRAHAAKGSSYKLLQRVDKYYESLWEGMSDV